MADQSIPAAMQTLLDRQAIYDCLVRYCRGIDRFDKSLLLSAYHPDAQHDVGIFCGSAATFAEWVFPHHARKQRGHQHYILNHSCEIEGDTAHTETYYLFAGINLTPPPILNGGRYIDRFERRDGIWAIADRKCLVEWTGFVSPEAADPLRVAAIQSAGTVARDTSDTSYDRPLRVTSPHHVYPDR